MTEQTYFFEFINPISKELSLVARELENSIFSSPRTMLTHSRIFVENILEKVFQEENLIIQVRMNLKDKLDLLNDKGILTSEVRNALHHIRQIGNQAAHDTRAFRFSEALLSWESLYLIVKWFIEVYGPVNTLVPDYRDPSPRKEQSYDITELEVRLKALEKLLSDSLKKGEADGNRSEVAADVLTSDKVTEIPGFTPIRTIKYKEQQLEVPYFLRDAFLLPQRFEKSEIFLIRLGAEQQARIMSELPNNLEGLHKLVKRYNEKHVETFFNELNTYIKEERIRRQITLARPGELFLFHRENYIVVTKEISETPLTTTEFIGIPSLLRQLNKNQIEKVGQLPKELVILAKYENVGIGTVEKLFEQLKTKQNI